MAVVWLNNDKIIFSLVYYDILLLLYCIKNHIT